LGWPVEPNRYWKYNRNRRACTEDFYDGANTAFRLLVMARVKWKSVSAELSTGHPSEKDWSDGIHGRTSLSAGVARLWR
jgi:hypothetical protein